MALEPGELADDTERCDVCGYPLEGLPRRGRCPECGTPYDQDAPQPESPRQRMMRRRLASVEPWLIALALVAMVIYLVLMVLVLR